MFKNTLQEARVRMVYKMNQMLAQLWSTLTTMTLMIWTCKFKYQIKILSWASVF